LGESVRVLAVMPKQKDQEDILENVLKELEEFIKFTITSTEINSDPQLDIYDKTVQLSVELTFNTKKYLMHLEKRTFTDENVIIELSILADEESRDLADDLYQLKLMTKTVLNTLFKGVYWQKDTQNEKTCSELYASIHVLENRFREVIVKFMVNKFGFQWTKKITDALVDKIELYSKWYRDNYDDFRSVKTEIFNLQISDLISLLESAYEKQPISEADFVKSIVAEGLDAEITIKLIQEYKENSDVKNVWEKYFIDVLGEDFPNDWGFLKNTRNMVAHNKPICSRLYSDAKYIIERVMRVFDGVEDKFSKMFITHEDIEIEKLWFQQEYLQRSAEFEEIYFTEAGIEPTPSEEDVIQEITEHDDFQQFITISDEYISNYRALIEETRELLEEGSDKLDFSNRELLRTKIKDVADLLYLMQEELPWGDKDLQIADLKELSDYWYEIKTAFEEYLDILESKINDCKYTEVFSLDDTLITLFSHDSVLEVETRGYICPEKASSDNISIKLTIDSEDVTYGEITKYYGDYEIEDTGGAKATHSDGLWIAISEVLNELSQYADKNIEYITRIRNEVLNKFHP
jgi:hypothetical protein